MNKSVIWKPVKGYEGIYEVSSLGEVKSLPRLKYCGHEGSPPQKVKGATLKESKDRLGYSRVKLSKNGVSKLHHLHRIVALSFVDSIENKLEVNHIDGDKDNNSTSNLEWVNRSENMKHAFKIGLIKSRSGEKNNLSKLKEEQVIKIRKMYEEGATQKELSEMYNVSVASISGIVNFKTWKEVAR